MIWNALVLFASAVTFLSTGTSTYAGRNIAVDNDHLKVEPLLLLLVEAPFASRGDTAANRPPPHPVEYFKVDEKKSLHGSIEIANGGVLSVSDLNLKTTNSEPSVQALEKRLSNLLRQRTAILKKKVIRIESSSFEMGESIQEPTAWIKLKNTGRTPIHQVLFRSRVYAIADSKTWLEKDFEFVFDKPLESNEVRTLILAPGTLKSGVSIPRHVGALEMLVDPVRIIGKEGLIIYDENELLQVMIEMSKTKLDMKWARSRL